MHVVPTSLDLTRQAPRSPRERLAGFVIAKRAIDICRATIAGQSGVYSSESPLDRLLFEFKGITGTQFAAAVESARDDAAVAVWLEVNGIPRTAGEIRRWSDETEASSWMDVPERRARFMEDCAVAGLNPVMNSTFDWVEASDRDRFVRRPASAVE
jgi:hypothetical protein